MAQLNITLNQEEILQLYENCVQEFTSGES